MISTADYKYFNKAREIAALSDFPKIHIGCIAVYQGNIIGTGCNTNKTHPKQVYYNQYRPARPGAKYLPPKIHAEIHCLCNIQKFEIPFQKVKLYIYRIRRDQPYGLARPCPSCMAAIKDLGIRNIYYTTNYGYAYEKII